MASFSDPQCSEKLSYYKSMQIFTTPFIELLQKNHATKNLVSLEDVPEINLLLHAKIFHYIGMFDYDLILFTNVKQHYIDHHIKN